MMLGKLNTHMEKNETVSLTYTYIQKLNRNGLNDKCKTWNCKSPGRKQKKLSLTSILAVIFLNMIPKAQVTKVKNKWDYIKF